ncbi:hypothetical protein [Zavarzinia aquatilis]|uniref:Uncharacterized protein n=1 Tax=Zavarzinia aquatilis TaxID=2211142 RepID=A0A317DZK3_9PROT|nr:hypothetical protein [Zavarzinia aquatilis]PWR20227.1 hypothetical protein DKG74_16230 [Zavarzinia aquatilis]
MRRIVSAAFALLLLTAAARAEPPPPPGLAALARDGGFVERFLAAALDGPPYYNPLLATVNPGRLARIADGRRLNYFAWRGFPDDEPASIARIRALTGLGPAPEVSEPGYDDAAFMAVETRDMLAARPVRGPGIAAPFFTASAPETVPGAVCGVFVQSGNVLRPRELSDMTVHVLATAPPAAQQRCLARAALRALGLAGIGEYADGVLPAAADPVTLLTPEEEGFLWLLYRLPVGADRETLRAGAVDILDRL